MNTIYFSDKEAKKNQGLGFGSFKSRFEQICLSHQAENRAKVFAFILYDFRHAEIVKILNDYDYWRALYTVSGFDITVFSFHYCKKAGENFEKETKKFIESKFGSELNADKPTLLVFQVFEDKISEPYLVEIKSEVIEEAFIEIRGVLSKLVTSLSRVLPENRNNRQEMLNLVAGELLQIKGVRAIKKLVCVAKTVKEFVGK